NIYKHAFGIFAYNPEGLLSALYFKNLLQKLLRKPVDILPGCFMCILYKYKGKVKQFTLQIFS
ncbi:hypothetical protein, partial [Anaerovibrio slackiae]|uniref:hypothetical protein n=1 Tax=Anaerovibrio slackiae TaxID=2652309 RepID=UPI00197BA848